ncbi:MAG: hypothetical protein IPN86_23355 [Saprospiraceae bacterium]|nr:hypothetical protein [Saprospiraceae bacterium]
MKYLDMKVIFLTISVILLFHFASFGQTQLQIKTDSLFVITNIGLPFDEKYLKDDILRSRKDSDLPISSFNFPVTRYTGSAGVREMGIKDENFYGVGFSIGNHNKFKNLFKNDTVSLYQDFFVLLCYSANTDSIGEKVSSRNFPDYIIGQGYMQTKFCNIDYTAFIDYNGISYAIINEKVFDLSANGKVIILVPSIDGSLNFIQVKTPYLNYTPANNYYKTLFNDNKINSLIEMAKQTK